MKQVEKMTDMIAKFVGHTAKKLPDDVISGSSSAQIFRSSMASSHCGGVYRLMRMGADNKHKDEQVTEISRGRVL